MAKRLAQKTSNLPQTPAEPDLLALRDARAKEMDSWGKAVLKEKLNRKSKFGAMPMPIALRKDSTESSD